ncbi:hypothetical protein KI387_017092, partial [Taxus chinensis]
VDANLVERFDFQVYVNIHEGLMSKEFHSHHSYGYLKEFIPKSLYMTALLLEIFSTGYYSIASRRCLRRLIMQSYDCNPQVKAARVSSLARDDQVISIDDVEPPLAPKGTRGMRHLHIQPPGIQKVHDLSQQSRDSQRPSGILNHPMPKGQETQYEISVEAQSHGLTGITISSRLRLDLFPLIGSTKIAASSRWTKKNLNNLPKGFKVPKEEQTNEV